MLDAMEKAAFNYAIANGVIVMAPAGNRGDYGMGYPGAYEPVISVAASGWISEWSIPSWWYNISVEINRRCVGICVGRISHLEFLC